MLIIKELNKNFDKQKVLKNINITANKGQIYGLVGSNGCGKTTLLKHIMRIYKSDSGEILYNGEQITDKTLFVEEFYYVQDNLFFPNQYTIKDLYNYEKLYYKNISREKFDNLVSFFNIDTKKALNRMSKGQKKQAAFIMAMATCPKVVLLDEIVDGLDAVIKRKFWNVLIQDTMENDTTVIISSHDLKELDNICDRVGIMHEGEIIKEEELEKLKNELKRVQFAIDKEFEMPNESSFGIIKTLKLGSVYICTIKGDSDALKKHLYDNYNVLLFDELPMNLEEIFITELGDKGYGTEIYKNDTDEQ